MEQIEKTPVATMSFSEEQFFNALAKVMTPIADGIVAILEEQKAINKRIEHFDRGEPVYYSGRNYINKDILELLNQDPLDRQGIKKIEDSLRSEIVMNIMDQGRQCPCCGDMKIVCGTWKTPEFINKPEFDVFYYKRPVDIDNVWLICSFCFASILSGEIKRIEVIDQFNAFHNKRRNF